LIGKPLQGRKPMTEARYYLFTGATSGLGLEAAQQLAKADPNSIIIAGVRQPNHVDALRRAVPQDQLIVLELDTASLASVKSCAAEVRGMLGGGRLSGMALNAGVQIVSGDRYSVDGYELTFATNVLGHIMLFDLLTSALSPTAVIVSTASGTHDKDHKLAKAHKFFGGFFPSAADVAAGRVSDSVEPAQLGRDRYATSKLCNILFTYAMARKVGAAGPRFVAFDPGLMPGTELARDHPAALRFAWKNILPTAAKLMDGASTAKRSGGILAQLLLAKLFPTGTGLHVEFTGREIPSSTLSHDERIQDALIDWARTAAG
jgi:NAD(P)-dependent dehydrogenase (short-subunit alcohol dehydrogenase family)